MDGSYLVIGAGGHGKVVVSVLQLLGLGPIVLVDDDRTKWGQTVLGERVQGGQDILAAKHDWAGVVLALGDNECRRSLARRYSLPYRTLVHPSAVIHPSVRLGAGTVVFAGALVQPGNDIGEHSIINTGAILDHDCRIGAFVHVAPGVMLTGMVEVGEGTAIGAGTVVIPGKRIGAWATLGAGSVVVRDIPDRVTAFGVPAKVHEPLFSEASS